jgi:bifunctional non-homologous end joining protein LigD
MTDNKRTRNPEPSAPVAGSGQGAASADRITHRERIVYPADGVSKGEVADYYRAVARWMLPELANRPLSLVRCPDGVDGQCFFQRHPSGSLGAHVRAFDVMGKGGASKPYVAIADIEGLLDLVQGNVLELHAWGARVDRIEQPDRLVFDLDPGEGVAWNAVIAAARDVRAQLRKAGLRSWVRLTGGKGVHVVVPFRRGPTWEQAKEFSGTFARALAARAPQTWLASAAKSQRKGRIFIDWLRNARGASSVCSWSLRARAGAPVAMPIAWSNLSRIDGPAAYTIVSAQKRAAALQRDPWAELAQCVQSLPDARSLS